MGPLRLFLIKKLTASWSWSITPNPKPWLLIFQITNGEIAIQIRTKETICHKNIFSRMCFFEKTSYRYEVAFAQGINVPKTNNGKFLTAEIPAKRKNKERSKSAGLIFFLAKIRATTNKQDAAIK